MPTRAAWASLGSGPPPDASNSEFSLYEPAQSRANADDVAGVSRAASASATPLRKSRRLTRGMATILARNVLSKYDHAKQAGAIVYDKRDAVATAHDRGVDLPPARSTMDTTRSRMDGNAGAALVPGLFNELEQP